MSEFIWERDNLKDSASLITLYELIGMAELRSGQNAGDLTLILHPTQKALILASWYAMPEWWWKCESVNPFLAVRQCKLADIPNDEIRIETRAGICRVYNIFDANRGPAEPRQDATAEFEQIRGLMVERTHSNDGDVVGAVKRTVANEALMAGFLKRHGLSFIRNGEQSAFIHRNLSYDPSPSSEFPIPGCDCTLCTLYQLK